MKYPGRRPSPRPNMVLVDAREGSFWREKRSKEGDIVAMNKGMTESKNLVKMLSPAAAKFVGEIRPYLSGLITGRINIRVQQCLRNAVKETGGLDYRYMSELEFQPQYPLYKLLKVVPKLEQDGDNVVLRMPIPRGGAVKALNSIITGYRLVLIMVVGDMLKGETLNNYETRSPFYERGKEVEEGCELRLIRPEEGVRWICMLRIVSYEGSDVANNSRHAGMKVVGWG